MGLANYVCGWKDCDGVIKYYDDDYASLSDGGSYEIYECQKCKHHWYIQLPD